MSRREARKPVWTRSFIEGAEDELGNPVKTWADPVEQLTYGWATTSTSEPKLAGHDREVVEMDLLVPYEFTCGPKDLVLLPDGEYRVVGYPEDYNHGPNDENPGYVVNLKRVEG